jgi:hypothetical protein
MRYFICHTYSFLHL